MSRVIPFQPPADKPQAMSDCEFRDAAALAALPCLVAASPDHAARRAFEIAEAMVTERHIRDGAGMRRADR